MNGKLLIGDSRDILRDESLSSLLGKIKLVYIDPPYNTNINKSYRDFGSSSIWKQDMICILKSLKNFLSINGAIFISIDDNEYANLKIICDRIFGAENFIGTFITHQAQRSNSKHINIIHEYIICYAREASKLEEFSIRRMDIPDQRQMIDDICSRIGALFKANAKLAEKELKRLIQYYCDKNGISWLKNYNCIDNEGNIFFASDLSVPGQPRSVDIEEIGLHLAPLKTRSWTTDARFIELHKNGLLAFRNGRPYCKKFLKDARDNAPSILNFYSRFGTRDLNNLGLRDLFDTPKPVELVKFLIRLMGLKDGDCVLDCFAGSGTTAQAVIEVNLEDKKDIDFTLVQIKARVNEKSIIFDSCAKYGIEPYISEITKLRIGRVLEKYELHDVLEIIE